MRWVQTVAVVILAFATVLPKQACADDIDDLIELSGLTVQLTTDGDEAAAAFLEEFEASGTPMPGREFVDMVREFFRGIDYAPLMKTVLAEGLSRRQTRRLLRWYRSDLGRRITALEVSAAQPEEMERMMAQLDSLLEDEDRLARAAKLDELLSLTDSLLSTTLTSQVAIVTGILRSSGVDETTLESTLKQIEAATLAEREQFEQLSQALGSYTYRALSDTEFDRYLEFLARPEAQRFYDLIMGTLERQSMSDMGRLGDRIGAFLIDARGPSQT
ncbi:MAG: DUF2059 domain-containing protein [Pseudomonadota bacterium]